MNAVNMLRHCTFLVFGCSLVLLQGCAFARISLRNVPAFFRTPAHVTKLDRHDIPAGTRLSATWIGHATVLIQMDDRYLLTDPVLTTRIGIVSKRLVEPGFDLDEIPPLSAVVISHRHLDHLSPQSLKMLGTRVKEVVAPPGAAADLKPNAFHIQELALWETTDVDGVRITAVPAVHDGGRTIGDRASHPHAYTGYLLSYHGLSVYFPGDTAYRPELFSSVRNRFGAIDLALMPIGPIEPVKLMQQSHMNPSQAVAAASLLEAKVMLPIHFETFVNSLDSKTEDRDALNAADHEVAHPNTRIIAWRIGQSVAVL